ncbi:uncharacterized protein BDV14DRAFT_202508 [Aspergillus stella-maris]|uniref:uncharacterized protein n=1 Tax=Aspergillus stella-maris TaxID=1810926 RepID=UPI003CCDA07C
MARPKNSHKFPNAKWISHHYRDHAGNPAVLMAKKATNPASEWFGQPVPGLAVQVYSTVPIAFHHGDGGDGRSENEIGNGSEDDLIKLCTYLTRGIDTWPTVSFEIYSIQDDVWSCVVHQRREISHRKTHRPGDDFFPGIAKAVPNPHEQIPQGFLLVITSDSFRTIVRSEPEYEDETGPLWVNFNRAFADKTRIDAQPSTDLGLGTPRILPERDDIVVKKMRGTLQMSRDLGGNFSLFSRSQVDEDVFEYALDEDEGDPAEQERPPSLEIVWELQRRANSLDGEFVVRIPEAAGGSVAVTSRSIALDADLQSDLQYIIYVTFPHPGIELSIIARAFTAEITKQLSQHEKSKTINFEFHSMPSAPLSSILSTHRTLLSPRPNLTIGRLPPQNYPSHPSHRPGTRLTPQNRIEETDEWSIDNLREPYDTFIVILDRADFFRGARPDSKDTAASGVLFLLADGGKPTEEWMRVLGESWPGQEGVGSQMGDTVDVMVWRCLGMAEAARRLGVRVVGGREIDGGASLEQETSTL